MKNVQIYMTNILEGKWVFDSQILVYSLDVESPYHADTIQLFKKLTNSKFVAVVALQNILEAESVFVKYYHLETDVVIQAIEHILDTFQFEIIAPLATSYLRYHTIARSSTKKTDLFDYFLAATMLDNNVTNIITGNDKDFIGIDGLSVYNPFKT